MTGFFAFGQTGPGETTFNLITEFGTPTLLTDSTWNVPCVHPSSQFGLGWLPTQIVEGDLVFDSNARRFRVKVLVSANFGESVLEVVELQDENVAPTGVGIVHNATVTDKIPLNVQDNVNGLSPAIIAKIHTHNATIDVGGGGGGNVESVVDGTNVTVDNTDPDNPIVNVPTLDDADASPTNEIQGLSDVLAEDQDGGGNFMYDILNTSFTDENSDSRYWLLREDSGSGGFSISSLLAPRTEYNFPLDASGSDDDNDVIRNVYLDTHKLDSLTFTPASDTSYTVRRSYIGASVVRQDTVFFPVGGGGGGGGSGTVETVVAGFGIDVDATDTANPIVEVDTTEIATQYDLTQVSEVADGTTITGVGSVGDPFAVDSEEVGHRLGEFVFNSDSTKIIRLNQTRLGGSGALVVRTGIDVNTPYQEIEVKIPYYSTSASTSTRTSGTYRFVATIASSAISNAYFIVDGNFPLVRGGYYAVENGFLVVVAGETTSSSIILTSGFEVSTTVNKLSFSEGDFSITKSTNITSLSPTTVSGIPTSFFLGTEASSGLTGVNATGFTLTNTGNSSSSVTGVKFNMIPNSNTTPTGSGFFQSKGVAIGARSGPHLYFATPSTNSSDPTERMVILNNGNVGIGQTTPSYLLDLNGTGAMRIPVGTTAQRPIGASSLWRFNSTTGAYEGHNGTSFGRLYLSSDATPTNGQVRVFNSASGMDVYTTLSTGTMSDFDLAADTGTSTTIEDSETITIAGTTSGIDTEINGNTVTVSLDQGEITANSTAEPDMFFLAYDASDAQSWNVDIDVLSDYIPTVYNAGGDVPSNTTLDTDDGAGITWGTDNVDIHGAEVTINGAKPFLNQTIPIYCQGKDDAPTTGSDYRGWRVPSGIGSVKIVGIQYSYNTPGTGTTLIQLTNGTINFGGTTMPASGYVDVTTNQSILVGQLIKPDISTINGTGHEGLMVNIIIQKN